MKKIILAFLIFVFLFAGCETKVKVFSSQLESPDEETLDKEIFDEEVEDIDTVDRDQDMDIDEDIHLEDTDVYVDSDIYIDDDPDPDLDVHDDTDPVVEPDDDPPVYDNCLGNERVELLVENADIIPPMETAQSTQGEGTFCRTTEADSGLAVWPEVSIPCNGTWYVVGRVWSNEPVNSFYLSVASHEEVIWNFNGCDGTDGRWSWDFVSSAPDTETCDPDAITGPAAFQLDGGSVEVNLRGREIGSGYNPAVSRLYLVTDPDTNPDVWGLGTIDITGPGIVPDELQGLYYMEGEIGAPFDLELDASLIWAGDIASSPEGCSAFPENSFEGAIALIRRGSCQFSSKVENAVEAGALAVIVYNNQGGTALVGMSGAQQSIPAVFISQNDGDAIVEWVNNSSDQVTAVIYPVQ